MGCRLNLAEGESIRALLTGRDAIVVNSCAVTNEAVKQTRQAICRARRERPGAELVVTGCAAQIDPHAFAAMPEVDRVIGNGEKLSPAAWAAPERVQVADIFRVRETAPHLAASFAGHVRAFVEVQNGCDHRCTFCVIPYGRGNSRSAPAGAVVDRVAGLVEAGHREVVLTGVDLTSYGPDLPGAPTLGALVERILRHVPRLERLRLSSLDSIEIDDRLFAIKGAGGAMLREKVVAAASDRMVVIADSSKRVAAIGAVPVPVEILPFARASLLAALGQGASLRLRDGDPYVTDNGNWIADCRFDLDDPAKTAAWLDGIPGVLGHGLFLAEVDAAYVATGAVVSRLERDEAPR